MRRFGTERCRAPRVISLAILSATLAYPNLATAQTPLSCATLPEVPAPDDGGRKLYVSKTGTIGETGPCSFDDITKSYSSLRAAANCARAGDAIYFRGGAYGRQVAYNLNRPDPNDASSTRKWIVVKPYPGEHVVLTDSNLTSGEAVILFDRASWVAFGGFEVTGSGRGSCVVVTTGDHVVAFDNFIHDCYRKALAFQSGAKDVIAIGNTVDRAVKNNMHLRGATLSGAEWGLTNLPGTFNDHYTYPDPEFAISKLTNAPYGSDSYFRAKGMNVFRVPFRWERIQPQRSGALDALELQRLRTTVDDLTAAGSYVIFDVHNFGRYETGSNPGFVGVQVSNSEFADLWGKLAGEFLANHRVIFGLMNEPAGIQPATWLASANAAIARIRAVGAKQLILVPGTCWTSALGWSSVCPGTNGTDSNATAFVDATGRLLVSDPENNFAIEVHQYMDQSPDGKTDYSGRNRGCALAQNANDGVISFTTWARNVGAKAFLGEFGGDNADPSCVGAVDNLLTELDNSPDVWIGWTAWAGGPWWGADYLLNLEPQSGRDAPMMTALEWHLGTSPSGGWDGTLGVGSPGASTNECVTLKDNIVRDTWGECLNMFRVNTGNIIGNTASQCFSVGIYVDSSQFVTVNGNYVYEEDNARTRRIDGTLRRAAGVSVAKEVNAGWPLRGMTITNNIFESVGNAIEYASFLDNDVSDGTPLMAQQYESWIVAHNTMWWKADTTNRFGYGISIAQPRSGTPSGTNRIVNNIAYKGPSGAAVEFGATQSAFWSVSTNLFPEGVPSVFSNTGSIAGDPWLKSPPGAGDATAFKLRNGSVAIDAGTTDLIAAVSSDFWNVTRNKDAPSIGADEASGPTITNVKAFPAETTAEITWTTDTDADGAVEYGTLSAQYVTHVSNATLVKAHALGIGGLSPNTKYFFRVVSKAPLGRVTRSQEAWFVTASCTPDEACQPAFQVRFVGTGGFSSNGQPTLPSDIVPNDLLIVRALTSMSPAGWAAYGPIFWKRFTAGDATPNFGAGVHAQMAAFRGVATVGSPFEALGQTLRVATYIPDPPNITDPPRITTLTDGSMVLLAAKTTGIADGGFSWIQFGNPISGPARSPAFVWDFNPGPTSEAVGLWYGLKDPAGLTESGAIPQVVYELEGDVEYTSALLAIRPPAPFPPSSPATLTGPATDSDGTYTLSWSAASGYVDRYELYERGVLAQSVSALSATITGRPFGTYSYRVQACNEAGCSTWSPEFVVTVAPPSAITFVGAGTLSGRGKPGIPSNYDVNDILVVVTVGDPVAPSGWTRQAPGVYWKRAVSGEIVASFGSTYAQMAAYRGCVTTGNPFAVTGVATQGTVGLGTFYVPGAQSITTASNGSYVLLAAWITVTDTAGEAQSTVTDPASGPARSRAFATASWVGDSDYARAFGLWHDVKSLAGVTGAAPGNHVAGYAYDGSAMYATVMLALRPAP